MYHSTTTRTEKMIRTLPVDQSQDIFHIFLSKDIFVGPGLTKLWIEQMAFSS